MARPTEHSGLRSFGTHTAHGTRTQPITLRPAHVTRLGCKRSADMPRGGVGSRSEEAVDEVDGVNPKDSTFPKTPLGMEQVLSLRTHVPSEKVFGVGARRVQVPFEEYAYIYTILH